METDDKAGDGILYCLELRYKYMVYEPIKDFPRPN